MIRAAYLVLAYLFLAICVFAGATGQLYLHLSLWIQLAFAALVGMAVGGMAPKALPGWLALPLLICLAWLATLFEQGRGDILYLFPAAASVGVVAGLVAWRLPDALRFWRLAPLFCGAAFIVGLAFLGQVRIAAPVAGHGFRPFPAPAYSLHLLSGKIIRSRHIAGTTVVLAFWATWCRPCREELPRLQALYERRYRNDPGVSFYLVDLGEGGETRAKARSYLRQHHISLPSAFDAQGRLMRKFRLPPDLPTRLVVGAGGIVRYRAIGYGGHADGFPELRNAIRSK